MIEGFDNIALQEPWSNIHQKKLSIPAKISLSYII